MIVSTNDSEWVLVAKEGHNGDSEKRHQQDLHDQELLHVQDQRDKDYKTCLVQERIEQRPATSDFVVQILVQGATSLQVPLGVQSAILVPNYEANWEDYELNATDNQGYHGKVIAVILFDSTEIIHL